MGLCSMIPSSPPRISTPDAQYSFLPPRVSQVTSPETNQHPLHSYQHLPSIARTLSGRGPFGLTSTHHIPPLAFWTMSSHRWHNNAFQSGSGPGSYHYQGSRFGSNQSWDTRRGRQQAFLRADSNANRYTGLNSFYNYPDYSAGKQEIRSTVFCSLIIRPCR